MDGRETIGALGPAGLLRRVRQLRGPRPGRRRRGRDRRGTRDGILDYYGELIDAIETPEAVPPGETFEVVVWTWGGGCLVPDSITVADTDEGITLTPYDRLDITPGDGCTDDLREMPHEVDLSSGDAGELVLTAVGRRHYSNEDVLITVSVTIAVE